MLVVEPGLDDRARYRKTYRGPGSQWTAVSLELRVVENECAVCGRRPSSPTRLQAAHLVSEFELFLLGLRERYLCDRRGLVALCRPDHRAFDLVVVGVFDERRLNPRTVKQLRSRVRRFAGQFHKLTVRRMRFLAAVLAEVDRADAGTEAPA
jgi:hypothetical protein